MARAVDLTEGGRERRGLNDRGGRGTHSGNVCNGRETDEREEGESNRQHQIYVIHSRERARANSKGRDKFTRRHVLRVAAK